MALHAALLADAHLLSRSAELMTLGAYCGALAAFIVSIMVASAWHQAGAHAHARVAHVFVVAWLCAAWGALISGVIALLAAHTGDSSAQRIYGAALIGPGFAALFAGRFGSIVIQKMAASSGATPAMDGRTARRQLALAAAAGSGVFGALHPWVRFPAGLPEGRHALAYAGVAVVTTLVILPLAGARLMRSLRASGRVKKDGRGSLLAAGAGLLVTSVFAMAAMGVAIPTTHADWALWRALVGALLGSCGVLLGASVRK